MDFLTGTAYWGIIGLVILNALAVSRMTIVIRDDKTDDGPPDYSE